MLPTRCGKISGARATPTLAFFLSVLSPAAHEPNGLIYLAFIGAAVLAAGIITLGVGLLKASK